MLSVCAVFFSICGLTVGWFVIASELPNITPDHGMGAIFTIVLGWLAKEGMALRKMLFAVWGLVPKLTVCVDKIVDAACDSESNATKMASDLQKCLTAIKAAKTPEEQLAAVVLLDPVMPEAMAFLQDMRIITSNGKEIVIALKGAINGT